MTLPPRAHALLPYPRVRRASAYQSLTRSSWPSTTTRMSSTSCVKTSPRQAIVWSGPRVVRKDCSKRGPSDYLLKPFDREAILAALTRIPPQHGRLLVVDDDPQVVDLVRQLLEGEPYEVVAATDGQEALEAISHPRPDIVLLDLLMPRLDGFAVIEHLQQDVQYRQLPVIVLTAKTLTTAEYARLDQSVRTVIQKRGLDRGMLIEALQGLLRVYRDSTQVATRYTATPEG